MPLWRSRSLLCYPAEEMIRKSVESTPYRYFAQVKWYWQKDSSTSWIFQLEMAVKCWCVWTLGILSLLRNSPHLVSMTQFPARGLIMEMTCALDWTGWSRRYFCPSLIFCAQQLCHVRAVSSLEGAVETHIFQTNRLSAMCQGLITTGDFLTQLLNVTGDSPV